MSYIVSRDIPTYPKGACAVSYKEGMYRYSAYLIPIKNGLIDAERFNQMSEKRGFYCYFHESPKDHGEHVHELSFLAVLIERFKDRLHHEKKGLFAEALNGCMDAFFALIKLEDISAEEIQSIRDEMMKPYVDKSELKRYKEGV